MPLEILILTLTPCRCFEITFKRIEKIRNFYWRSSNIVSQILKGKIPRLDTITNAVEIRNDFSIESLCTRINGEDRLDIDNTSLAEILFPKVQEIEYVDISNNSQLDTLNLIDLKRTTMEIFITV